MKRRNSKRDSIANALHLDAELAGVLLRMGPEARRLFIAKVKRWAKQLDGVRDIVDRSALAAASFPQGVPPRPVLEKELTEQIEGLTRDECRFLADKLNKQASLINEYVIWMDATHWRLSTPPKVAALN
jgi:hypothetical protein